MQLHLTVAPSIHALKVNIKSITIR